MEKAFDRVITSSRGFPEAPDPVNGKSLANLTLRERQVMRMLAEGKSVRQCADALGLAPSTIDNHKSRLMKKLSVHRSSQLTLLAIREGLIDV